jgi:hypothetical protein
MPWPGYPDSNSESLAEHIFLPDFAFVVYRRGTTMDLTAAAHTQTAFSSQFDVVRALRWRSDENEAAA